MAKNSELNEFSSRQIESCCLAMLAVARANGLAPAELELIRAFWEPVASQLGDLDEATTAVFSPELFVEEGQKNLLVDLCLACAFADGDFSAEEKAIVASIAAQVGLTEEDFAERIAEVRTSFLGALAHLPDTASVAALGSGLK